MIPITEFAGREVAVFGLARSGLSAAKALKAGGAIVHAWDDNEAARAAAEAEGIVPSDINARDWRAFAALVLSPGIPLTHPKPHRVVDLARAVGVPIVGDIELFARAVNALPAHARPKIVGVTGTNGKSTTTSLIGHILQQAGRDVRVGGNIGAGVLGLEPLHAGAIYVLELSSYQLDLTESLRCSVAVFLNLSADHLDRHGDMAGYLAAKKRIFRNQGAGDMAVVGVDDAYGAKICTELTALRRSVSPISAGQALSRGVSTLGGRLYDALGGRAELVMDLTDAITLPGRHNAQNVAAAYATARALGVANRDIAAAIATFPGLAHRLELAGVVEGVRFINDSKATNAEATAQALAVYPRVYWIAGGKAKDGGIESLARFFPRIVKAYLVGEAAPLFAVALSGHAPSAQCGTLDKAVAQAFRDARAARDTDAVVLLSPACASFDQFKDFEERGAHFKSLVVALDNVMKERAQA
ncbi:MAG: UDP-N-acetylmuramoyl-L-alanine--D-glutamate ligase [Hyphomonadaceae bacterium]|nr:UDP-N-acetylmuramoyl-L-alanine--D-glutamate ligase [Hyphomonadaceae bacterium]